MVDLYDLAFARAMGGGGASASKEKWLVSHGAEYIRIPKEDLAFTDKPGFAMKLKLIEQQPSVTDSCQIMGGWSDTGYSMIVEYKANTNRTFVTNYNGITANISQIPLDRTLYTYGGYTRYTNEAVFDSREELQICASYSSNGGLNNLVRANDFLVFSAMSYDTGEQWNLTKAKIAYLHLYDNNVLIFDGVPKVDPTTGKACLYDSISGKYYGNANAESSTDFEIVEE